MYFSPFFWGIEDSFHCIKCTYFVLKSVSYIINISLTTILKLSKWSSFPFFTVESFNLFKKCIPHEKDEYYFLISTDTYTYPNERIISYFVQNWVIDTSFPLTVTHDNGCVRVAKTDWSHSSLRMSQLWYLKFCCDCDKEKAIKWCLVVICLPAATSVLLLNCFIENNTSLITERGRKPHQPPCPQ